MERKNLGMSAVIGVILMVTVTVVIVATVYVYIDSFSSRQYESHTFFCGAVEIGYNPCNTFEGNDQLILTFCKEGNYDFKFYPNEFGCYCQNEYQYNISKEDLMGCCHAQCQKILETWTLPVRLTVVVTLNETTECYTFE